VNRIADKIILEKERDQEKTWKGNIAAAKAVSVPNLDRLVENLYILNVVDKDSYLALVCFLMQMKHSRDGEVPENDKTCVFFNGVARNGKSATARAICDFESQYGEIFFAKSGKILESNHAERVWKSHLNYFDEVKPTDIDRELLLCIVNGGEVEINPKNKRQYMQHVNTNNIFTSNDRIALKQRRVSIIKFGDRLNGRPAGEGKLKKHIAAVMDSLPNWERYHEIFDIVSRANESRINPLAIDAIISFINTRLNFVKAADKDTLDSSIVFAPHEIFNHIKGTYTKQTIMTERKEAIIQALEDFTNKGWLSRLDYKDCTTRYFHVVGRDFLKIMEWFDKVNTKSEENERITTGELRDLLLPYFIEPKDDEPTETSKKIMDPVPDWMQDCLDNPPPEPKENLRYIPEAVYLKGKQLVKDIEAGSYPLTGNGTEKEQLYSIMTDEACQTLRLQMFLDLLQGYYDEGIITDVYVQRTGLSDPKVRTAAEKQKHYEQLGCPELNPRRPKKVLKGKSEKSKPLPM